MTLLTSTACSAQSPQKRGPTGPIRRNTRCHSPTRLLTSGNAAPSAILLTPSTRGLRYRAATCGFLTSLTRFSVTTTVRRCTSILRSFSARISNGTRTARAGAVTSATKVVEDSALIHAETVSGLDMHLTSAGTWGTRSGFASVLQSDVAHLTAAVAT